MTLFSLEELAQAAQIVEAVVMPTPALAWPLLRERTGADVYVKHENHTPIGAFKVRGGLVYFDTLRREGRLPRGVVSASRGNHGQSVAFAATRNGIASVIVVPNGNSVEKNAAIKAFGAELVIAGDDFDESRELAAEIAQERGYHLMPSFHRELVRGVATYARELLIGTPRLDSIFVSVGMGSGICGLITVRDLLGLETEIVGLVADRAPSYALSFEAGQPIPTSSARTFADGMACRNPHPNAVAIIRAGAARILRLSEDEIAAAIRIYYQDTHNLAEGAGAAPLAGLIQEGDRHVGKRVALILSGGNIDAPVYANILNGLTPQS